MTTKKSANVVALRLNLGGAPNTWHMVGEYPGLWHPQIAVPVDVVDGDEAWAQARHDDPGCHLELVRISEDEADAGRDAFADATGESREGLLARLNRARPEPDSEEATRIHAEAMGATATVTEE